MTGPSPITPAAEEAVAGDLPAQQWIDSLDSNHWFEVAGINPDVARAAIRSRRAASHRDNRKLDRLIAKATRAQDLADLRWERANRLAAELGRELQPRLPLGDD